MESGVRSQDTSSVYSVRETADARGASERGQAASDLHCRTGWLAHGPVSTGGGGQPPRAGELQASHQACLLLVAVEEGPPAETRRLTAGGPSVHGRKPQDEGKYLPLRRCEC